MTRIPAVGDAIPDDAVSVVEEELEVLGPCNPTSYDLGFALRRKEEGAAVHLDLPAAVRRLHAHDDGHVLLLLPVTTSGRNALAGSVDALTRCARFRLTHHRTFYRTFYPPDVISGHPACPRMA